MQLYNSMKITNNVNLCSGYHVENSVPLRPRSSVKTNEQKADVDKYIFDRRRTITLYFLFSETGKYFLSRLDLISVNAYMLYLRPTQFIDYQAIQVTSSPSHTKKLHEQ